MDISKLLTIVEIVTFVSMLYSFSIAILLFITGRKMRIVSPNNSLHLFALSLIGAVLIGVTFEVNILIKTYSMSFE